VKSQTTTIEEEKEDEEGKVVKRRRKKTKICSKKEFRAAFLNTDAFQDKPELKWVLETPYDVRDEGMNDLLKAYDTNFKAGRKGFDIRFRSKKAPSQSIVIHAKHWKRSGIFHPTFWGKEPLRGAEPLPEKLDYDSRLQRTRLGEYYLCVPQPLVRRSDSQAPFHEREENGIVSLDPGVRTFMTGYSPGGHAFEWGWTDIVRRTKKTRQTDKTHPTSMGRLARLCHALDKLQSKWSQADVRHRKRYTMQRAGRRIRKKIHCLVDDVHRKLSKWLCENYTTVLLPKFETQKMVSRARRRFGSKTARAMLTWSHYRFRQRLQDKTREYPWCKVIEVDEHYTSKTCGQCGVIHWKLGKAKTFVCPSKSCQTVADRDLNAARNILLRYLTLNNEGNNNRATPAVSRMDQQGDGDVAYHLSSVRATCVSNGMLSNSQECKTSRID